MKFIFYVVIIFVIISCDDHKKFENQLQKKPESSNIYKHKIIGFIESKFQSKIDDWEEYENLSVFLDQYISISPNDALNNSRELNDIAKSIYDSVKPVFLETPAFNARINLLFNETLRLYDMSSIPTIKAIDVNEQIDKIINAFSAINFKINTILKQRELENEIKDVSFERKESKKILKSSEVNSLQPLSKKKPQKKKISKKNRKMILLENNLSKKKKNSMRKRDKKIKKKDN